MPPSPDKHTAAAAAAADAGLRHVSDTALGIRRQRRGRGFGYVDADGRKITDAAVLQRIRALAVPPAQRALAAVENAIVREVASAPGNTPTVCRKAYIDPVVFAGWRDGRVQRAAANCRGERQWEAAALRFLRRAHGSR